MPNFFTNSKVIDLINTEIENLESLKDKEQKKLLAVFQQARLKLIDRMMVAKSGSFTQAHLSVTITQVQAAINFLNREMKKTMSESSKRVAEKGIDGAISNVNRLSSLFEGIVQPLKINNIRIALNTKNFLINKHTASIDAYTASLRSQITSNLVQSLAMRDTQEITVGTIIQKTGRFFIGEEWKVNRIVRTEMANIYNFSKLNTLVEVKKNNISNLKKSLMHPIDKRTAEDSKELAAKNPIVDLDKPFTFVYKDKKRSFMFPPDRPNDRAIMVPYTQEWGKRASEFKTVNST